MGYCFISRSGTVASKKTRVLLKENVAISLSGQSDESPYYTLTNVPMVDYSKIELVIDGRLGSAGGAVGYDNHIILSITDTINTLLTLRTVESYGSGKVGSESISGTYSFPVPSKTSSNLRFTVSAYNVHKSFSGTVSVYGIT